MLFQNSSYVMVAAVELCTSLGEVREQGADDGRHKLGHADAKVSLGQHGFLH